jgi:hypothetical protein
MFLVSNASAEDKFKSESIKLNKRMQAPYKQLFNYASKI